MLRFQLLIAFFTIFIVLWKWWKHNQKLLSAHCWFWGKHEPLKSNPNLIRPTCIPPPQISLPIKALSAKCTITASNIKCTCSYSIDLQWPQISIMDCPWTGAVPKQCNWMCCYLLGAFWKLSPQMVIVFIIQKNSKLSSFPSPSWQWPVQWHVHDWPPHMATS